MNDLTVIDDGNNNDVMMAKVLEAGNIEVLERFIALREREESRQAAIEFDAHFSEMQSEFVPVIRDKKGYAGNYAPIESLQKQYGPIIAKHGFSYTWTEEAIQGGKRCTLRISGHGSARYNSFDIPELGTNKQMNAVQAAGAMSTYGRRYTFIAGFGVIIDDEDADGAPEHDPAVYADAAADISDAQNLDDLMKAWKVIYARHSGDTYAMKILTAAKDKRKGELSGTTNG